ncbi:hypothetical protein [Prosthecobacter vanneervenii]|uniref:Uncharacterized protein n=1 Tax=Prosthecobacter vanneervenii TaxID=48466 RepID=A0A7W7YBD8_9BACT|nr:hypothetical protein [Prosthecobacter vanneervenii]MBB5033098.1 hypothetical protein [Prosthecobacter vanneervenii]
MGRFSEHEGTLDFVHEASGVTIHRGPGGWINDPVQSPNQGDASKAVAAFRRFGMDMAAVAISVFLMASRFRRFWQYVLRSVFFPAARSGQHTAWREVLLVLLVLLVRFSRKRFHPAPLVGGLAGHRGGVLLVLLVCFESHDVFFILSNDTKGLGKRGCSR